MRTQFKGTINGKEFDNVQDYNAEMQRLIAAGESINAHADTQTIETPANDNSFLFPGFAQCTNINNLTEDFIDAALELDCDTFVASVNDLLHNRINPAITKMNDSALASYRGLVTCILEYLGNLADESDKKADAIIHKLEEIEKELGKLKDLANIESDRKEIIDFVTSLYESIRESIDHQFALAQATLGGHKDPAGEPGPEGCPCQKECTLGIANPGEGYIEEIKAKARKLFGI